MPSVKERLQAARDRFPWFDHVMSMLSHYGSVNGNAQAGAITYFGFLSFFPILALAFFVIGLVSNVYPDARSQLVDAINQVLPGLVGSGKGEVPLKTIEKSASAVGLIGLVSVIYSGLGWLSGLRSALEVVFVVPKQEQPNFVFGKLRDLGTLALVGITLFLSVALSGAVTGFSGTILEAVGIDSSAVIPTILLWLLGHVLGIVASTLLLLIMFKLLLAESHVPRRAMISGALLGAVLFEVLKQLANLLLASTKHSAAFAAFGVALILLVWINYFSRFVLYGAAWAYTSPDALALRQAESRRAPGAAVAVEGAHVDVAAAESANGPDLTEPDRPSKQWPVVAGAAGAGALAAWLIRGGRS